MITFLVCSSHFFSYCSFVLDLSKTEMIYMGKLHVFFVFNHKQTFLSDWEIDCKWIAMKLHEG